MIYILDTNICIYWLKQVSEPLIRKVKSTGLASMAITNSVLAELYFGAYHSGQVEENRRRIERFKKPLRIYADDEKSAEIFGRLKAALYKKGRPVEDFDLLLASIALANDCTLVTNNTSHFKRIPDLRLENWSAAH